jgi:hypothetical protein
MEPEAVTAQPRPSPCLQVHMLFLIYTLGVYMFFLEDILLKDGVHIYVYHPMLGAVLAIT